MPTPGSRMTLVVADDEAPIRMVVSEKLRTAGYTVYEARDGEEALALTLQHNPAAVITDLQMPYLNGLELALRLRAERSTSATPILLLTARGHILADDQISRTNIRKVISKPFSARDLLAYVQTTLVPALPGATAGSLRPHGAAARSEAA